MRNSSIQLTKKKHIGTYWWQLSVVFLMKVIDLKVSVASKHVEWHHTIFMETLSENRVYVCMFL